MLRFLFSTGFFANLGTIPAITSRHSVIFSDKENHACIAEGCALSLAKLARYRHNDMDALKSALEKYKDISEKLIVCDGVFSMNGAIANLPGMVELAKQYGAKIFIDDAHGLGVIGDYGRGTGEHFNMEDDVDIVMGTFSKSLASIGGYVAGPKEVMSYVKHKARALIFSASPPPASVAVALKCLELMQKRPELRTQLLRNTDRARNGLRELGYNVGTGGAAIVPVFLEGDREHAFTVAQALFDKGLFSTPVIPPAVPQGTVMIRTSYMASHTDEDIDEVVRIFGEVGEELGLLVQESSQQAAAV